MYVCCCKANLSVPLPLALAMSPCPSWWHFVSLGQAPVPTCSLCIPKLDTRCLFFIGTLELPWCCLFYSGAQLLIYLQVYKGGGERHEKSFGSLCWCSCPCAGSWRWHAAERLETTGPFSATCSKGNGMFLPPPRQAKAEEPTNPKGCCMSPVQFQWGGQSGTTQPPVQHKVGSLAKGNLLRYVLVLKSIY